MKLAIIICALCSFQLCAQTVSKKVLSNSGKTLQSDELILTWTLGELIVGFEESQHSKLGLGFLQENTDSDTMTTSLDYLTEAEVFSITPSLTTDNLILHLSLSNKHHYLIIDHNGRISKRGIAKDKHKIDVSQLSSGSYWIYLLNNSNETNRVHRQRFVKI